MTRTFYANGKTGQVFIYAGTHNPQVFDYPRGDTYNDIHFHSDLAYLGSSQVVEATITHPRRQKGEQTDDKFFGLLETDPYSVPLQGTQEYILGPHSAGADAPFVPIYNGAQIPAGSVVQTVEESVRAVSVFLTGGDVRVFENWATFEHSLPAVTRTYKVYLFETLFTPSGTTSVRMLPGRFTAGFGKLDTNYRYIRESDSPDLYLAIGKSADVEGGGWKTSSPDGSTITTGSYTGRFPGVVGRGVKV